jgi:acetamidase/formamidase
VNVPGALLSLGDGHAVQGDGEVCATAVECAMRTTMTVSLKDIRLSAPLIVTPNELLVTAFARTLDEAVKRVIRRAIDILAECEELSAADAYMLCSVAGDVRVNQVVALPHVSVRLALPVERVPNVFAALGDPPAERT